MEAFKYNPIVTLALKQYLAQKTTNVNKANTWLAFNPTKTSIGINDLRSVNWNDNTGWGGFIGSAFTEGTLFEAIKFTLEKGYNGYGLIIYSGTTYSTNNQYLLVEISNGGVLRTHILTRKTITKTVELTVSGIIPVDATEPYKTDEAELELDNNASNVTSSENVHGEVETIEGKKVFVYYIDGTAPEEEVSGTVSYTLTSYEFEHGFVFNNDEVESLLELLAAAENISGGGSSPDEWTERVKEYLDYDASEHEIEIGTNLFVDGKIIVNDGSDIVDIDGKPLNEVAIDIRTTAEKTLTSLDEFIVGKEYTFRVNKNTLIDNIPHDSTLNVLYTEIKDIINMPQGYSGGTPMSIGINMSKYGPDVEDSHYEVNFNGYYLPTSYPSFGFYYANPDGEELTVTEDHSFTFVFSAIGTTTSSPEYIFPFITYQGFTTQGTLTDDQFEKLTSNNGNYILADNKKFEYAGTVDGVMHYSCTLHNVVYCMDITIATKGWNYTSTRNIEYEQAIKYLVSSELALADFEHEVGTTNTVIVIKPNVLDPQAIYDIALEIEGTGVHYGVVFTTFPYNGSQCITTSLLTVNGSTEECYATMDSNGQVNLTIPYVMSPESEDTHIFVRKR